MTDRAELASEQHVRQLFAKDEEDAIDNQDPLISSAADLVTKYDGKRLTGSRKPWYQRIADKKVCVTDPDATPMKPSEGGSAVLGYHDHYVVDGGRERIILSVLVTPASIMDNTPLLDLIHWVRSHWQLDTKIATGDAKYGTAVNIAGLEKAGIKAYLPIPGLSQRTPYCPATHFQYDAEQDQYICPQDQVLPLYSRRKSEQVFVFRVDAAAGQNLKRLLKKKKQEILVKPSEKGQSASTRFIFFVVQIIISSLAFILDRLFQQAGGIYWEVT